MREQRRNRKRWWIGEEEEGRCNVKMVVRGKIAKKSKRKQEKGLGRIGQERRVGMGDGGRGDVEWRRAPSTTKHTR